jgi:Tfp pilus assembly protein PilE
MTLVERIVAGVVAVVAFAALAFIIYNQQQVKKQQTAIQTQIVAQQQLVDGIVRSQSQYATKDDMTQFANANNLNLQAIQSNLAQLNSTLTSINVITAGSTGQTSANLPSTSTGAVNPNPTPVATCKDGSTCPNTDPFGYQQKQQNLVLNEDFTTSGCTTCASQVPIGGVGFSAWQQNPWNINLLPRTYNVDTVVGVDENQRQTFYNKFTVNVSGKDYDIPIKNATTKQQYPSSTFSFWNPRLLMGLDGGLNISRITGEITPHIDVAFMSYGQYKTNPDLSILAVGLGYGAINKTGELVITPVSYNIGKKLLSPLMNNTYIGASFMIGTDGSLGAGLGLRMAF